MRDDVEWWNPLCERATIHSSVQISTKVRAGHVCVCVFVILHYDEHFDAVINYHHSPWRNNHRVLSPNSLSSDLNEDQCGTTYEDQHTHFSSKKCRQLPQYATPQDNTPTPKPGTPADNVLTQLHTVFPQLGRKYKVYHDKTDTHSHNTKFVMYS